MPPAPGRKRWTLPDGPQGSLRRLRNQLAEDGCADSQVVLAKQLLEEECELEVDKISNFKQALDWLICATEQAHPEARVLLKRCVRSGVLDKNSATIVRAKSCLEASRQETVARKAARDLFASLSNGEQYITTAQLERRIREICSMSQKKESADSEDSDEAGEHIDDGNALEAGDQVQVNGTIRPSSLIDNGLSDGCAINEDVRNITVENLVNAAVDYSHGEMPLISYELTLTDPNIKALDHIPYLSRAFLHPMLFFQILYLKLLYYFSNFSIRLSNIEVSLLLIVYLTTSTGNVSKLLPLAVYYITFISMVVYTFKMMHAKRQFVDFRKWSGLFLRYSEGNLDADESENLFVRNNLGPFLKFFFCLFVNLLMYPFVSAKWVLFSEFCIVSFFLMFFTLVSFGTDGNSYPDILLLVSFCINVLAKYPYEKDTVVHQGWRFLDLQISTYPSYTFGNSIEFCLNSRFFFSLLIPIMLVSMAHRNNWQGVFKYALPHCVTLSWLQMFIVSSHGSTMYGLIRGTLAIVCTFLFVPIMGVVTIILPIFASLQFVTMSKVLLVASLVLGFGVSVAVTCVLAKHEVTRRFITPFQVTIGFIAIMYFGHQIIASIKHDGLPSSLIELLGDDKSSIKNLLKTDYISDYEDSTYYVSWDDYYNHCNAPSWVENNMITTQLKCSVLDGLNVNWEGYVKNVKLKSISNVWKDFASWLPWFLEEYFKCYFGKEHTTICDSDDEYDFEDCQFVKKIVQNTGKLCHLNNLNEYEYEIKLDMETGGGLIKRHAEITVSYNHHFTNLTRLLRSDDKIRIKGKLSDDNNNIGSARLHVEGYAINCLQCKIARGMLSIETPSRSKFSELYKTALNDCILSAKYILNFLLNPIVIIK